MFSNKKHVTAILLASCCVSFTTSCLGKGNASSDVPKLFPCQWTDGIIPYVFDFYSITSTRIFTGIRQGHQYIQNQSCLTFEERNPIIMAQATTLTYYLYYTFSNALDDCCRGSIEPEAGRRIVLLMPGCKEPHEVAHVILHMLGLSHKPGVPFSAHTVAALFHMKNCSYAGKVTENPTSSAEVQGSYPNG